MFWCLFCCGCFLGELQLFKLGSIGAVLDRPVYHGYINPMLTLLDFVHGNLLFPLSQSESGLSPKLGCPFQPPARSDELLVGSILETQPLNQLKDLNTSGTRWLETTQETPKCSLSGNTLDPSGFGLWIPFSSLLPECKWLVSFSFPLNANHKMVYYATKGEQLALGSGIVKTCSASLLVYHPKRG